MKGYKWRNKANEKTKRKNKNFVPCNPVTGTDEKTRVSLICINEQKWAYML